MHSIFENYLGKKVDVVVDRPLGSKHPKHDIVYEVNYGFVPNTKAPDGEEIDVYVLGVKEPIKKFQGVVIAIIHRKDDNDDKLVVAQEDVKFDKEEIVKLVYFQEQYFETEIIVQELK